MPRLLISVCLGLCLAASPSLAQNIAFDGSWKEQRFSLFSKNKYGFKNDRLDVASDGSVSMAYVQLNEALWPSRSARWNWSVETGVPATDLRKKGGDDRNLSLYAVFLPEAEAEGLKGAGIRKLLQAESARVLVYVWGGDHRRGDFLNSPYLGSRGKTVVLRGSGTGSHTESVNFSKDYAKSFGGAPGALVGLAVSADSDDTDSSIRGTISSLVLK